MRPNKLGLLGRQCALVIVASIKYQLKKRSSNKMQDSPESKEFLLRRCATDETHSGESNLQRVPESTRPTFIILPVQVLRADALEGITETERIRNIAIIAHATEQLLFTPTTSSATSTITVDSPLNDGFMTRVMDSNDLERECGITNLSKCTSVRYNGNLIDIVVTPRHADFRGEVERIMSMVDGVAFVVDTMEGPMIQTWFVLSKALSRGLKSSLYRTKLTVRPPDSSKTINHIFKGYEPYKGAIDTGMNGALILMALGESAGYAMAPLQARGTLFIHPQTQVYPGMVVGESSKSQDIYINPCVKKQLTNIRAAGADEKIVLASPRVMTLEEALIYGR
ncbi:P-loop containing nucleoside triphosphate hydrolase protein [Crucibulum laeve]|uniref:P-loop containing nucleoside triphosphate hydrolase protein n=1 Tax=Crucibulum laeve TaxID=68775 RepID=A0A5C3LTH2_9AGAR|nr:P-loop containing nucleoside triphosphate hydrolase protein [Crucibulum laeve]